MKLPRNVNGIELVKGLRRIGYEISRQKGDHVYLTTQQNGEHHVAVPLHKPVKVGTLASILSAVGAHLEKDRDALLVELKL